MNNKILIILLLTIVALVFVYLSSFGLLPNQKSSRQSTLKVPSANKTQTLQVNNTKVSFATYHNTDIAQDYYTFKIPQNWHITTDREQGSYQATFDAGTATIGTHDVPDNSTLELFVLSQDEPALKGSLTSYKKIAYQKLSINGLDAYQLIYQYNNNQKKYEATRTYITGQDKAGLLIFTTEIKDFSSVQPIFSTILNSFHWENK